MAELELLTFNLAQMDTDSTKHQESTNPPLLIASVVCRYYHPCVGYGDFVREYNGCYGLGLIIRLENGREWFAPINEFTRVR